MIRSLALALSLASPALAQETMDAEAFDAHVTGRTIVFSSLGREVFGIERYMDGRRVMWSSEVGRCLFGIWYESKGDICFRYDDDPDPHCWTMWDTTDGLVAALSGGTAPLLIREEPERDDPLICDGLMF